MFVYPKWVLAWWPAVVVAVAAAGAALAFARAWRGPALALAFYAGTIFPALGFFTIYPMRYTFVADHYQYLASLGILALLVGAASRLPLSFMMARAAAAALLLVLGALTWRQSTMYTDAATVWERTLQHNPECWMCHNNLANTLVKAGRFEEALPHYDAALRAYPQHYQSRLSLASTLDALGRHEEAREHWQIVLLHEKLDPEDLLRVAAAHQQGGRPLQAVEVYSTALARFPGHAAAVTAVTHLSQIARDLALHPDAAGLDLVLAESIASDLNRLTGGSNPLVLDTLAAAQAGQGRFDEAVATATGALELARAAGYAELALEIESRLTLYRGRRTPRRSRYGVRRHRRRFG
jgi:tetratricopeptide (TPR) repeat protein